MSGQERRRDRDKDLRSCILEAARELFVEHGYDAVTMRKLAERIEYSPTAIYQHFEDKKSLVQELCALDFGGLAGAFSRLAGVADPLERLRRMADEYLRFARDNPNHYRFMFMTPHPPGHDAPNRDSYAFLRWTVGQAIEQGRLRPELADPDLVAQMVWGAIHGVIALQLAMSGEDWVEWRPLCQLGAQVVEVLVRGITPAGWSGPGPDR